MNRKKQIVMIAMMLVLCQLTGCNSGKETREKLFSAMQKKNIIDDDLELVDIMDKIDAGILPSITTYYVYQNDDKELTVICYYTNINSGNDWDYTVTIYEDVKEADDVQNLDDANYTSDRFWKYEDGKKTADCRYELDDAKEYQVYKKFLWYEFRAQ